MGSQQQLFIILSVIIVAAAIVVGMDMFTASYDERITEIILVEVHNIGMRANIYRLTPKEMAGGGRSYKGFNENLNKYFKDNMELKKFNIKSKRNRMDLTLTLTDKNEALFRIKARYRPVGLDQLRIYNTDTEEWDWYFKREK